MTFSFSFVALACLVSLVARSVDAVGQACTYYGTSGTCISTSSCLGAFGASMGSTVTGCESDPAGIQCCANPTCTYQGSTGRCRDFNLCSGSSFSSAQGASGCGPYPSAIRCCITGGTGPSPTPRPPTPMPIAAVPTPVPPGGPCTDGKGLSGTCRLVSACADGVSTSTANGANGCQTAGAAVCCTTPACAYRGVQGTCSETTKACFFDRFSSSQGATGCSAYPTNVNCCLDGPTPVVPTPAPTTAAGIGSPCSDGKGLTGTCQTTAGCSDGVSTTTAQGANGCQTAGASVFCCTRPSCTVGSVSGRCSDTSKTCSFARVSSSAGASGCGAYPSTVNCCPFSAVSVPTPAPGSSPTPAPGGGAGIGFPCTDGKGASGTCQTTADCSDGVSTTTSAGANGCQTAGSNVFCCTRPICSVRGVFGKCSETSKSCAFTRVSSSGGATGCNTYPTNVNCCPEGPVPPVTPTPGGGSSPTPVPGGGGGGSQQGDPCTTKGVAGTCEPPSSCSGLVALASDGASGCTGGSLQCCTQAPCSWTDPFGLLEDTSGQCRNTKQQSACSTRQYTTSQGARGCMAFNNDILCCLDNVPQARAMPVTPMPVAIPLTPAPTPAIALPPATECSFFGVAGQCSVSNECFGVPLVANQGAVGCTWSDVGTVCCVEKMCSVTDSAGMRMDQCRESRRCQDDEMASYGVSEGGAGCEMFAVGTGCCSMPPAGSDPVDPPVDPRSQGLTETVCSVPVGSEQRAGTCMEADVCGGDFFPQTTAGFMGCRNAAQFATRGCCLAKRGSEPPPLPGTVCTIGNAASCPFGEVCTDVNSKPTCIVDRNFDCKAAGACIVGGQECAPDGPDGAYVCGAARTCRVIPCQRADAKCLADASGLAQCVLASDCHQNPCAFDQICRPDPRGTRFPSVCAPKVTSNPTVRTTMPPALTVGNLQVWQLALIIAGAILYCLILICVIVAVVVALQRRTSYDYESSGRDGLPMTPMTVHNPAFGDPMMGGQGAGYNMNGGGGGGGSAQYGMNGGAYAATMNAGAMYPSGMQGGQSIGTGTFNTMGSEGSQLGRGAANENYPSAMVAPSQNGYGHSNGGGGSVGYGGGSRGGGYNGAASSAYGGGGQDSSGVYPSHRQEASGTYGQDQRPLF